MIYTANIHRASYRAMRYGPVYTTTQSVLGVWETLSVSHISLLPLLAKKQKQKPILTRWPVVVRYY